MTMWLMTKFREACCHFAGAKDGNTAVIFALASIPLFGLVGAAIDYGRASQLRTAMQAAADTTALMISQNARSQTGPALQDATNTYYNALFIHPEVINLQVTGSYDGTSGQTVLVSATGTYKTMMMNVLGFRTIQLTATSTASFGNKRLRVALVLDNTGSMADAGKMDALKTATNSLLDQLQSAAVSNGDVYVSIVPFVKDVNVGRWNYNASWIDWSTWNQQNGTCSDTKRNSYNSCINNGATWTPNVHSTWNGCVVDRGNASGPSSGNYDTNVVAPTTGITATLFPAEQYSSCPAAAMGLSYDWSTMKTLVSNMSPAGNTNQAIGLALGWMSLVGGGPFTMPAEDSNYIYSHVVILLTDGLNTQDRWYTTQSSIDARQAMTCANAKAAGITLYMIQVDTDGSPTSTLLQNCASDSSKFFLLTSASQIVTTFNQIGTNLSKLHIAK